MTTIKTKDGSEIYFKDWGSGQPIVLCHGWPLSSDMWEYQMSFLASNGYRCVAHDRRGFGRSSQPWTGYDYDTFADDLATLIETLDLKDIILVGFAMGGGEVARYIGRHGTKRLAKAALLSSVPPFLVRTADHEGVDGAVFAGLRDAINTSRQQFVADWIKLAYGANRPGAKIPEAVMAWTFGSAMQASFKGTLDCVTAFSETDFRADLKAFNLPTLILHGDDDQIVPFEHSGRLSARAINNARLEVYSGAPHCLFFTHKDRLNEHLLSFTRA